jgi:hypothetical protein
MNKLLIAVTLCSFGTAYAQSGTTAKPATAPSGKTASAPSGATAAPPTMEMPKPGADQDALKPFVHNGAYTGTRVGPDGKEMATKGKQTCKWLPGNMWAACDIEMTSGGPEDDLGVDGRSEGPGHAVQGARHRRRHRPEGREDDVRGLDGRQVGADRQRLVQDRR